MAPEIPVLPNPYQAPGGLSAPTADRAELLTFPHLTAYSQIVARLNWDATSIDLSVDARAWPDLPLERRRRLTTLLAGFRVAEDAVAEHLSPFADASEHVDTMMMWVFFLQRRDEDRHALFFDRVAAEVLKLPGSTPVQRRAAARDLVPPELLELFEEQLPKMAGRLSAGQTRLVDGVGLYHMVLEGAVFASGQQALLDELSDGVLPGVREGVEHVELDERWHVGFGVRTLIMGGATDVFDHVLELAPEAAAAWGDAVPQAARERAVTLVRRRLAVAAGGEDPRVTPTPRGIDDLQRDEDVPKTGP